MSWQPLSKKHVRNTEAAARVEPPAKAKEASRSTLSKACHFEANLCRQALRALIQVELCFFWHSIEFASQGNIVVECRRRDGREHAISQLIIVAISLRAFPGRQPMWDIYVSVYTIYNM